MAAGAWHYADLRPAEVAQRPSGSVPDLVAAAANRQAAAGIQLGVDLAAHSAASLALLHEARPAPS